MKRNSISLVFTIAVFTLSLSAGITDDARRDIDMKHYDRAIDTLRAELEANPASSEAGQINALLGEALFLSGEYEEAAIALDIADRKGVANASRWLGRLAAADYDFAQAAEHYARYMSLKNKAGKPIDPIAADEKEGVAVAEQQLQRVQCLEVIDSIVVPKENFFEAYRLPRSAGRLLPSQMIPEECGETDSEVIYSNEKGDYMMWAATDSLGVSRIAEVTRLTDGSWSGVEFTDTTINIGEAGYPFMMPDGTTLYFAAKGPMSIGGYDIFIASRDPSDNTYLLPQNLGMPINSPFDDYMLAIDEENNVGWWATDRNRLGDDITIYIFIPWEVRETYPEDTPGLIELAKLSDISMTQPEDADYTELLETLEAIDPDAETREADFHFRITQDVVYTTLDDFTSDEAYALMQDYLEALEELDTLEQELKVMRTSYHNTPSRSLAPQILSAEKRRDEQIKLIRRLRGEIINAEKLNL